MGALSMINRTLRLMKRQMASLTLLVCVLTLFADVAASPHGLLGDDDTPWEEHFEYQYYDGAYEELSFQQCEVRENFASPYVEALFERVTTARGCSSREISRSGKHVHVINLLNGDSPQQRRTDGLAALPTDGHRHENNHVRLQLAYTQGVKWSERLVIVLSAQRPVIWTLDTTGNMDNASRHLFYVSPPGSRLRRNDKSLKGKVIKDQTLSTDRDVLVTWVRKRHGVVTSYTEVDEASTITKYLGIDPAMPAECHVSGNAPSGVAMYMQTQVTRGCVAPDNEDFNNKDVHIIEVDEAYQSRVTDIVIDITTRAKRTRHKNLLLLLKSHSPVNWRIKTQSLRGSIHIITEDSNDSVDSSEVHMQRISTAMERLDGLTGQELVDWTRDRYSPVLSYTGAELANSFHLLVDGSGGEEARLSIVYPDEDDSSHNEAGDKQTQRSPLETPGKTKRAVFAAQKVHCGSQEIQVALNKHQLSAYGIRKEHLTLQDERCEATENRTHFLLTTKFNECSTKMSLHGSTVTYENAIFIRKLPDSANIDLEEISGSGYDVLQDDLYIDDEDFGANSAVVDTIRVEFECPYLTGSINEELDFSYALSLFDSDNFAAPVETFPLTLPPLLASTGSNGAPAGTELWVEARVDQRGGDGFDMTSSGQQVRVQVHSCWLMDASRSYKPNVVLVQNQCPVDSSVHWLTSATNQKSRLWALSSDVINGVSGLTQGERFRFTLPHHLESAFLLCDLSACTTARNSWSSVPQCTQSRQSCSEDGPLNDTIQRQGPASSHRTLRIGPIQYDSHGTYTNTGHSSVDGQPHTVDESTHVVQGCTQIVQVQGLDSVTVVGIAFAAFLIGVLLMAALWLIHIKTSRRGRARARFAETSGESTPSSTAPIAIHQVNHH